MVRKVSKNSKSSEQGTSDFISYNQFMLSLTAPVAFNNFQQGHCFHDNQEYYWIGRNRPPWITFSSARCLVDDMYSMNCLCWVKENHFLLRDSWWKIRVGWGGRHQSPVESHREHSNATAHYLVSPEANNWVAWIFSSHYMCADISHHKVYNGEQVYCLFILDILQLVKDKTIYCYFWHHNG